jgi:hypothetical protein
LMQLLVADCRKPPIPSDLIFCAKNAMENSTSLPMCVA